MAQEFPPIRIARIYLKVFDEWYGVVAEFEWAAPFDVEAYKRAVWAEGNKWFGANPKTAHVGYWPLEEDLQRHIAQQIISSFEYSEFFEREHYATIWRDEEDREGRRVRIPKFMSLRDWSDWNVTSKGGSATAAMR
jgi:hypothetical protein